LNERLRLDPYYIVLKRRRLLQRLPKNAENYRKKLKERRKKTKHKGPQTKLEQLIKSSN